MERDASKSHPNIRPRLTVSVAVKEVSLAATLRSLLSVVAARRASDDPRAYISSAGPTLASPQVSRLFTTHPLSSVPHPASPVSLALLSRHIAMDAWTFITLDIAAPLPEETETSQVPSDYDRTNGNAGYVCTIA